MYSLRSILVDSIMNVFRYILVIDISILASTNMDRREYLEANGSASNGAQPSVRHTSLVSCVGFIFNIINLWLGC
jgi:hypothetical protein